MASDADFYRRVANLQLCAENLGLAVDVQGDLITLTVADKKKLPHYVLGAVLARVMTIDAGIAFLSGWVTGELYANEAHRVEASKKNRPGTATKRRG